MKANQLREKDKAGLNQELLALRKEQFNLRMQRKMGQPPKTHLFRKARRAIARIKTILNQETN